MQCYVLSLLTCERGGQIIISSVQLFLIPFISYSNSDVVCCVYIDDMLVCISLYLHFQFCWKKLLSMETSKGDVFWNVNQLKKKKNTDI